MSGREPDRHPRVARSRRYSGLVAESRFVFPVSDLLSEPGARREIEIDAPVTWGYELADIGPEVRAEVVLENASGVLVVRGPIRTGLGLTCHRCLTEWDEDLEVALTEAVGFDDGEDEEYAIERDVLDLEPLLRDAVLLEVPLRPLCRPDCLGLCATCGADLNTGPHPEHEEEGTSPFAGLRDLLEP